MPMFENMAKNGELLVSGNLIAPAGSFYPALTDAYTYNKTFDCVPKDSSTLALEINTSMWKAAGLTTANLPTTWAKLAYDAKKLTTKSITGLVVGDTLDRLGAFMAEAGGSYMNSKRTGFTFKSPQNLQALNFIEGLAKQGVLKFPEQLDAGWAGEAFGEGKAAMTAEGNWIIGAMQTDYPKIPYEWYPCRPARRASTAPSSSPTAGASPLPASTRRPRSASKISSLTGSTAEVRQRFRLMLSRPSVAKQWAAEHTTPVASGNQVPDVAGFVQGDCTPCPGGHGRLPHGADQL